MSTTTPETNSYKGWMNSDSFMKRAFGVLGYYMVAALIVNLVVWGIILVIVMMFGGLALLINR